MKTRVDDTNSGLSAQLDYSLPGMTLTSITAQRKWENHQFQDQDRLSMRLPPASPRRRTKATSTSRQFTQELRVASTGQQTFDYVAGLFYFNAKNDEQYRRDVTRCPNSTAAALPSGLIPCSPRQRVERQRRGHLRHQATPARPPSARARCT